ncbi:putative transcriptional regulator [Mesorhizobium alhagi CCNWXJ12-2]|uniref:Putative transcriptional regulator n=1 Tax=Mesorhizobium alhagi CCNWXJ12-2 TaxID=1107882 RepID=H0HYW0_9HYPH|nr:putative transcriptional regulator [Mesorhizobium alhagi CCNWXJ12-2]
MGKEIVRSVGRFVGLEQPRTLSTRFLQLAEIVGTRLRWDGVDAGAPVRMERRDGYLICLQRTDLPSIPYWVNDVPTPMMPLSRGKFLLLDLNEEHASVTRGTVDCVSMFASREALQQFRQEHDLRPVGSLRAANGVALQDEIIRNLGECLVPAFERPDAASQLFTDQIALALLTHLTAFYAEQPVVARPMRGGLARWQERRAKDMLLANLDGEIGLDELARACGLSRSHFARAFKTAVGMPPLQWLLVQRVQRAKDLLLNSALSIDQIAHHCGFADQSHFTRVFVRVVNATPGVWRRTCRL